MPDAAIEPDFTDLVLKILAREIDGELAAPLRVVQRARAVWETVRRNPRLVDGFIWCGAAQPVFGANLKAGIAHV